MNFQEIRRRWLSQEPRPAWFSDYESLLRARFDRDRHTFAERVEAAGFRLEWTGEVMAIWIGSEWKVIPTAGGQLPYELYHLEGGEPLPVRLTFKPWQEQRSHLLELQPLVGEAQRLARLAQDVAAFGPAVARFQTEFQHRLHALAESTSVAAAQESLQALQQFQGEHAEDLPASADTEIAVARRAALEAGWLPPGRVEGVVATRGQPDGVKVVWVPTPGAAAYHVYRRLAGSAGEWDLAGTAFDLEFIDQPQTGTDYAYRVEAANAGGTGEPSAEAVGSWQWSDQPAPRLIPKELKASLVAAEKAGQVEEIVALYEQHAAWRKTTISYMKRALNSRLAPQSASLASAATETLDRWRQETSALYARLQHLQDEEQDADLDQALATLGAQLEACLARLQAPKPAAPQPVVPPSEAEAQFMRWRGKIEPLLGVLLDEPAVSLHRDQFQPLLEEVHAALQAARVPGQLTAVETDLRLRPPFRTADAVTRAALLAWLQSRRAEISARCNSSRQL
jgi:hypothetical protein